MRIALVSEHASPLEVIGGVDSGGQNVHVAELARHLAATGAEVVVYTRRDSPDLPARVLFSPGVTVEHVDAGPARVIPKDDIWAYINDFSHYLRRAWRDWRPDVAHSHFWMSGHATVTVAASMGIPVVHTYHALGAVKRRMQADADTSPPERIATEVALGNAASCIVATCRDEMKELHAMGVTHNRIPVVPCGVDLTLFNPYGPLAPLSSGRARVLSIGRLVPRKGVEDVVRAMAEVPDADLVVAGGPPRQRVFDDEEVRRLHQVAEQVGVDERVEFVGRVARADIPALMRSASVAVCVPWYEPFGIVPLEAMACGTPVIGSAVGGLLDTIRSEHSGLLVPPRRPDRVADALRNLLSDDAKRQRLAAGAVARAQSYGWPEVAWRTRAVYAQLINGDGEDGEIDLTNDVMEEVR